MDPVTTAVLGCGTISDVYFDANDDFDEYDIVACADLDEARSKAQAAEYGIEALDPESMLEDDSIELVINLTPPSVHAQTCIEALEAGKHVYVEKPLSTTPDDADSILQTAATDGLHVGCAPDTFLGAGLQTARATIDAGVIGEPVGATAILAAGGAESWHPNPDIFYKAGGGPLFDMGPYYVTALVNLLGPATRVTGLVSRTFDERTITSEPRHGEIITVEVPTHETGLIEFADGVTASLLMSFDTPGGSTMPSPAFEIYGTKGTLGLPDPNQFDGPVTVQRPGESPEELPLTHSYTGGRGVGPADTARAIRDPAWRHRTSAGLAKHVLEVLDGIRESSTSGAHVELDGGIDRPAPLPEAFPGDDDLDPST